VSLFRRLFDVDYRRALAAEAAGDHREAARLYGLAGARGKVAEMHLRLAERAEARGEAIAALRDALAFAEPGSEAGRRAARGLARELLDRARREGIATERDRETVREAAALLEGAGELGDAARAFELAGDDEAAARAWEKGGFIDEMVAALARVGAAGRALREERARFDDHELHWRGGARDEGLAALRAAVSASAAPAELRRLLDRLEGLRIASARVRLARAPAGPSIVVCGGDRVAIGRDATCDLPLRAPGISRLHAEVLAGDDGFRLRDGGSRNGTWLGGLAVEGEVPLAGEGRVALGDDTELAFAAGAGACRLEIVRGLDRGLVAIFAPGGRAVDLAAPVGVEATLRFERGRPLLEPRAPVRLNGEPVAGVIQLVREDRIEIGGGELEVRPW
jgi:hypothetical protein